MHKPIQVTDKNLNVQEASEGEVSFGRPCNEYLGIDFGYGDSYCTFFETTNSTELIFVDRFPVDDEHSQNKI